jgi:type IV secretion system protein VirB11
MKTTTADTASASLEKTIRLVEGTDTDLPNLTLSSRVSEKLRRDLGPLILNLLQDNDVIEIMRNPDGRHWVERLGAGMSCIGIMPEPRAEAIVTTVAAMRGRVLTEDQPILECELPDYPCRFTAAIPPAVENVVFAIRRKASRLFTLDDYLEADVLTVTQRRHLHEAVRCRKNILICGGTGSGKTTLVNAIKAEIAAVAPADRIVVIEDTPEIRCCSLNTVAIRTTRTVTLLDALRSSLRLRPDRIVVGEVRGPEALALLKAWNTGHPGGIATLHANDARSALNRLESLVAEATLAPMQQTIAEVIDLVVSIVKTPAGRRIREIIAVHGHRDGQYQTSILE